jgi:GDP-4-dehydro-6-deoxy-D-mannose reductase
MTWLVTGVDGFAGSHMIQLLRNDAEDVVGTTKETLDLANKEQIDKIIAKVKPDYLVLCAGLSSLRDSFDHPEKFKQINCESAKHFLDAIRKQKYNTKVLMISSAMVYCLKDRPLKETDELCTNSPYAETKIMQEQLMTAYPDIFIINSRSFNHTGTRQKKHFLVPTLVNAFAQPENTVQLHLSGIDAVRDFTDVHDTCRAYKTLLLEGKNKESYNVCSNRETSIKDIIRILEELTGKKADIIMDNSFDKSKEVRYLVGDNTKIKTQTSWKPQIPLRETLKNMLNYRR